MIDLKTFKKILIKNNLTNLTNEEIIKLFDKMDQMSEVFFTMWVSEVKKEKNKV